MRVSLLLVLLATSASAQTPDWGGAPAPPVAWVAGGAAIGLVAVGTGAIALGVAGASGTGTAAAVLLYPVGAAAGIYGLARQSGRHVSIGRTARGAALGAIGLVAGGALVVLGGSRVNLLTLNANREFGTLAIAGLVIAVVVPPVVIASVVEGADVGLARLVGPDGERTAGLALSVAF